MRNLLKVLTCVTTIGELEFDSSRWQWLYAKSGQSRLSMQARNGHSVSVVATMP
jgi:hypothetical protein